MPTPIETSLDLSLLPIARQAGKESPETQSLYVAEPPRRTARGRAGDRLALFLVMTGNAPLSPGKQTQALGYLAELFYKTPGSATTAMRALAEELNTLFLKRNQRIGSSGRGGTGLLAQAVLRGDQLYLAISGPLRTYLVSESGTQEYFNPEMADQAIGQGRVTPLWFSQTQLNVNDTLILAAQPAGEWDRNSLSGIHGQGPETQRRKLLSQTDEDLNAVLIQARAGKGRLFLAKAKPVEEIGPMEVGLEAGEMQPFIQSAGPEVSPRIPAEPGPEPVPSAEAIATPPVTQMPVSEPAGDVTALPPPPVPEEEATTPVVRPRRAFGAGVKRAFGAALKVAGAIGRPFQSTVRQVGKAARSLLVRMLPEEAFKGLPSSVMGLIAVAIPVVVVAVASQVYISLGRDTQNQTVYAQALRMAQQAEGQTDLLAKRANWEATLEILKGGYDSPEIQSLRAQAVKALDELELVWRVDYRPAIVGGLPVEVSITGLAVSGEDLYLLDGNSGNVIRAQQTSQGYVIDPEFQCGPTVQGVTVSGPLIDLAAWPAGFRPTANVLAMDARGNVLLCDAGSEPKVLPLAPPSNGALGSLVGFSLDNDDLYVLDPTSNAVWIYWDNQIVDQPKEEPFLYFDNEIPFLQDVGDLTVSGNQLYLLHADGHLTVCLYNGLKEVPTRCSDPSFVDFRPGRENTPLVTDHPFKRVLFTPPPDPSLYLLEPVSQAIFHFSLRSLGFQRQYLPAQPVGTGQATAFAVNPIQRYLYLALGNLVYYAAIP
jgi:hypothetical protein